jgi:hypothetical protein
MQVKIGFSTSAWWVSRTIRKATHATVSHAYVVFDDPTSAFEDEVYEAAWCGFRESNRKQLTRGTTFIVQEIDVAVNPTLALQLCRKWAETPYDYFGLVGEAWVQLGKLFGKHWRNPLAGKNRMFCSEACVYLLQHTANSHELWALAAKLDARNTDPEQLRQALSTLSTA